jgi:hypothetical protein
MIVFDIDRKPVLSKRVLLIQTIGAAAWRMTEIQLKNKRKSLKNLGLLCLKSTSRQRSKIQMNPA